MGDREGRVTLIPGESLSHSALKDSAKIHYKNGFIHFKDYCLTEIIIIKIINNKVNNKTTI